jgi:histidinol-phosphatase
VDVQVALAVARELAVEGGAIAGEHYRRDSPARRKQDGTWVTDADVAVETALRARVAERFPEHNVLGEEGGLRRADGAPASWDAPTWVIDPIDATSNFMAGIPIWATLVALRIQGRNVVGIVNAPALGELYEAAEGHGARLNGDPIHVDAVPRLADAMVLYGSVHAMSQSGLGPFFRTLVSRTRRDRGLGPFWGHMLVARGAAHIMIEPTPYRTLAVWDVAPLEVIVTEAGGRLSRLDGHGWSPGHACLTTCGSIHDDVVALHAGTVRAAPTVRTAEPFV